MARSIFIPDNWAVRIPGRTSGFYLSVPDANSHSEAVFQAKKMLVPMGVPAGAVAGFAGAPGTHNSAMTVAEITAEANRANPSAPQFENGKLVQTTPFDTRAVDANIGGAGDVTDTSDDERLLPSVNTPAIPFNPGDFSPHVTEGGEGEGASLPPMFRPETVNPDAPASQGGTNESQPSTTVKSAAELALLYPDVQMTPKQQAFIDGILNGQYTPEQLSQVLSDPEFQAIFEHPEFGPLLNPALELAVTNATRQLEVAGGISQAEAQATNAGAILAAGGTMQDVMNAIQVGATGLTGDSDVLDSQRINASGGFTDVENMLEQQRIAASGGLDNNADILRVMEAEAANNAFGSLQLGGSDQMANILGIIEAQNSGQNGANAVAREANFLNFMGNPSAVGAATAAGFDPIGQMRATLEAEAAVPAGAVSAATAMQALETQDPNSGLGNAGLAETEDVGAISGLMQNFTEGQYDNASNQTQQNVSGQLAVKQGLGGDQIADRARSFTPGDTSLKRTMS